MKTKRKRVAKRSSVKAPSSVKGPTSIYDVPRAVEMLEMWRRTFAVNDETNEEAIQRLVDDLAQLREQNRRLQRAADENQNAVVNWARLREVVAALTTAPVLWGARETLQAELAKAREAQRR